MALFRLTRSCIEPLLKTEFAEHGIRERGDLQRLLKANISVVALDVLVIAEEFGDWEDSRRRIDLLGIDLDANLVVIELKRDDEGGRMELQALRYAAMASAMTFERAADLLQQLLDLEPQPADARMKMLEFLGWDQPQEFPRDVRIVLVSADFSKELTTTVLWLNERDLDIRCVRLKPYSLGSEVVIDAQQVVPLPEAEEYQVRLREKAINRREAMRQSGDPTGYWFMNIGDAVAENRSWDDRKKYGFMSAGGGKLWIDAIKRLKPGDQLFAYATGAGYVGFGRVTTDAAPFGDFCLPQTGRRVIEMPLKTPPKPATFEDPTSCDWCVGVDWINAVDRESGVLKNRAFRGTVCQIRQRSVVDELLKGLRVNGEQNSMNTPA